MNNQTVLLKAFVKELLSPQGIKELPELIEIYQDNVLMDFSPSDISKLICLTTKIDLVEDVTFVSFPKDLVTEEKIHDEVHDYNAYALTYDVNEIRLLLAKLRLGFLP
jgi:anionic cell wall polymer biosynthesis LytR-Cps2A-Psr (LCP) family protein